ncbi:hypothetical protein [Arthrobacter sp.]|uniref:SAP domain-containing protein n=1 Tax=Arthrobacter sp. TaxID=1667 RepID=UPI0028989C16|nr:hypothetical protein [Arthrobacter sp.]
MTLPERPPLSPSLSGAEFRRWYWLKDELQAFARHLGLRATGSKESLADRLEAFLDGRPQPLPTPAPGRTADRLRPPLTIHTVIPAGHPCSQVLRAFFLNALGPGFRFDAPMREFFAANDGSATLAAALDHWHATRGAEPRPIGAQFELNRFSRQWHRDNPAGSRQDLLAAWQSHRSLPTDLRPANGTTP